MASRNGSERGDDDAARAAPPQPLKESDVHLPKWATLAFEGDEQRVPVVDVDAGAAYPALLAELGVKDKPDQFWLETAFQCIKLDCQVALRRFAFEIRIHDPEKKWQQSSFPAGKGAEAATFGREAREAYRRLRGFVPS